jgi:hypothetical protein
MLATEEASQFTEPEEGCSEQDGENRDRSDRRHDDADVLHACSVPPAIRGALA